LDIFVSFGVVENFTGERDSPKHSARKRKKHKAAAAILEECPMPERLNRGE
jgi:hypothetical protein